MTNQEINEYLGKEVMGFTNEALFAGPSMYWWKPISTLTQAFDLVDQLVSRGWNFVLDENLRRHRAKFTFTNRDKTTISFEYESISRTKAICRAVLLVRGIEGES